MTDVFAGLGRLGQAASAQLCRLKQQHISFMFCALQLDPSHLVLAAALWKTIQNVIPGAMPLPRSRVAEIHCFGHLAVELLQVFLG